MLEASSVHHPQQILQDYVISCPDKWNHLRSAESVMFGHVPHNVGECFCQRKNIFPTGLGASPCTKPIWDSSESSSQAEPFITNRPCSPSTPNVHCHRVHSISYLRQQMQRCISFPIPGNRCRTSGLYNCAVSPALGRTSSTHSFIFSSGCPSCFSVDTKFKPLDSH